MALSRAQLGPKPGFVLSPGRLGKVGWRAHPGDSKYWEIRHNTTRPIVGTADDGLV